MLGDCGKFAFAVGCKREARFNIFFREVGEIRQNFFFAHTPARYSRTSVTVIRVPRIVGFPLRFPASIVMILL
jgi:hypothetical protein